tara:strand:+ start:477 stop:605 length:129 start_codon:yes stop_codon:yes gene_type:complete
MLGTTKHVINETVRLIEQYDLSNEQVKYLQDRLLDYNRPKKK